MTGTKEDMIVAFHILNGWNMQNPMRDRLQKQIANSRANAREDGRREGLEQAAKWWDEAISDLVSEGARRFVGGCIRALKEPPTTKTNGLDENPPRRTED